MDPRTSNFFNFLTQAVMQTKELTTALSDKKKYKCNFIGSISEIEMDAKKHAKLSVAGIDQYLDDLYKRIKVINHESDISEIIFILHNLNNHLEIINIQPKYDFYSYTSDSRPH